MAHKDIEELLERVIGLKITTISNTSFERVLNGRMQALGIDNDQSYLDRLKKNSTELNELIEEVVIPETWFFRDQHPFTAMVHHLSETWDRSFPLRILSIPCSSGEEPYSIAMALLLAGINEQQFSIDAIDISNRALERAKRGKYTKNSFRIKDLGFRDIFFTRENNHFVIKDIVRQCVRFLRGNIFNAAFVSQLKGYDIVFCRNILIYFNQQNQHNVIDTLWKSLKPGGVLFTGHAEAALFLHSSFTPMKYQKAFAFHKQQSEKTVTSKWTNKAEAFIKTQPIPASTSGHNTQQPMPSRPEIEPGHETGLHELDRARQLADQGALAEAAAICEQNLLKEGPSAQSFFLLGVIRDSEGETEEAIKLLRKAVYLDPQHHDSLVLLSLLAEQAGDLTGAKNYRRRASALEQNGVTNGAE